MRRISSLKAETSQGRRVEVIRQAADVIERFFERDHVGVFHRHVEEVDLVRRLPAVKDAFLDHGDLQIVRKRVDDAGAHAAAGGGAGDQ